MAKLALAIGIALTVSDVLWRGVILRDLQRIWHNLIDRPSGPVSFRFILQRSMAAIAAIHDGRKDTRGDRSPFLSVLTQDRQETVRRLREGLTATARIILLGLAMDTIYQAFVFDTFYPFEALIIALILALAPYLLIRGLVTPIVYWRHGATSGEIR
jgi:hypothetical protein